MEEITKPVSSILSSALPPFLTGKDLSNALSSSPHFHLAKDEGASQRMLAISAIHEELFIPTEFSKSVYSQLYLALNHSIQRREKREIYLKQSYKTFESKLYGRHSAGIMGGSDVFTIFGDSGIGKSTAIKRAADIIVPTGHIQNGPSDILGVLIVTCPHDCSVKGMLLSILQNVDAEYDTHYYEAAIRSRATTDILINNVAQVCMNNVGVLIIDEISNVIKSPKNGEMLINALIQLINISGISIGCVGTPNAVPFFEQDFCIARRSLGVRCSRFNFDNEFFYFCQQLWQYQYLQSQVELNDEYVLWMYQHSAGIPAVIISLFCQAQQHAIENGTEKLTIKNLLQAYTYGHKSLHYYIEEQTSSKPKTTAKNKKPIKSAQSAAHLPEEGEISIYQICQTAKKKDLDIIESLKEFITIQEVPVL